MASDPMSAVVPGHVPAELVHDYDVFAPGPAGSDFHVELHRLKVRAPAIFWTRHNEGHWYVTDASLVREMFGDPSRFSNRKTTLPISRFPEKGFIPVCLDPPEHTAYRKALSLAFSRKHVAGLEPGIRALAAGLIEEIKPNGGCEFMREFAGKLPAVTFLRLFDLPVDDRPWLLDEVGRIMRPGTDKVAIIGRLAAYLSSFVAQRRANPGDDLMSRLGLCEIDGERIAAEQLRNMCTLLLIGGLDSVANTLGFIAKFLAESRGHRRQIVETPGILPAAIEELLRRFPTTAVGTGRLCIRDTQLGPARIKAGDMLMTSTAMLNFDATAYPEPLGVDFSRRITRIGTFGEGVHHCIGAGLTRLELSIFLQEWLERIPEFELGDTQVEFQAGANISYDRLMLRWPPR